MKYIIYLLNASITIITTFGFLLVYLLVDSLVKSDLPRIEILKSVAFVFSVWALGAMLYIFCQRIYNKYPSLKPSTIVIPANIQKSIVVFVIFTAIFLWGACYALIIWGIDRESVSKANDDASNEVPHVYDLWMNNEEGDVRDDSDYTFITNEDIASIKNGNYLVSLSGEWGGKYHNEYLMYSDGYGITCLFEYVNDFIKRDNECYGGIAVNSFIKQIVPISLLVKDEFNTNQDKILMLIEYNGESILALGHLIRGGKGTQQTTLYADSTLVVSRDMSLLNVEDIERNTIKFIQSNSLSYQEVAISTNNTNETIWVQSISTKYGPVHKFVKVLDGNIVEVPLIVNRIMPTQDYTKYPYTINNNIGTLTLRHPLTKWYAHQFYARSGQFYAYATSTSQELMYFSSSCEQPQTFADVSFFINPFNEWRTNDNWVSINVSVSVPPSNTWNLTTALYGYEPYEWGQVKERVVVSDYLDSIRRGDSYNQLPTESYTEGDIVVRHILPNNPARPCDSTTWEVYQWVKEGNMYSVNLSYKRGYALSLDERKFVEEVVRDIVREASYVAI